MKTARIIALSFCILSFAIATKAFAGPETRCYSYGNANGLAYCLAALRRGGTIRTAGMGRGTAGVYSTLVTQQVKQPTTTQSVSYGFSYGPYAPMPVSSGTTQQGYSPDGRFISTIGGIAANVMSAAAWAYNWQHGYVGASGIQGASYMANYPW